MKELNLKRYLDGVIAKRLSEVEVDPQKSNQREFNATRAMISMLGNRKKTFDTRFVYLDDEIVPVTGDGFMTWYDAREKNPFRSEFRLFYKRTPITDLVRPGDCLFVCKLTSDSLLAVVTKKDSMMEKRLVWLFGIRPANIFEAGNLEANDESCEMIANSLLKIMGIEVGASDETLAMNLVTLNGNKMPSFEKLCEAARERSGITPDSNDADQAVASWMNCQDEIMTALLKYVQRLKKEGTFGNIIVNSKSVKTEKLENGKWQDDALRSHLKALLKVRDLRSDEYIDSGKQRLMLPGWKENINSSFPAGRLSVVECSHMFMGCMRMQAGIKTAALLSYVLTLDPGITESQMEMMKLKKIQPVVPRSVQRLYNVKKAFWFMSVEELLLVLSEKQEGRYGN